MQEYVRPPCCSVASRYKSSAFAKELAAGSGIAVIGLRSFALGIECRCFFAYRSSFASLKAMQ